MLLIDLILILNFVIVLTLITIEKGDKILVAMTGAGISLFLAILPREEGVLISDINELLKLIEPDLMFIIIGMTLLVTVTNETGVYEWIALKLIKFSKGNQIKLFFYFCFLSMIFAAFLDAYMAILIVGTITIVSSHGLFKEKDNKPINPKPFLIAEILFANIGGMLTRIASPPNLILGSHFNINFLEFTLIMIIPVLVTAVFSFLILLLVFRPYLVEKISKDSIQRLFAIDEDLIIRDPKLFKRANFILILTILGFFILPFLLPSIELGYIAIAGGFLAIALVSSESSDESLKRVEWSVVFFYSGLLTIVGILEKSDLLTPLIKPLESILDINPMFGLIIFAFLVFILSSILDNIPVAAMAKEFISEIGFNTGLNVNPLIWLAVVATNSGGNVVPIASAAGIQGVEMLNREEDEEHHLSFFSFFKIGFPIALLSMVIGIIYVLILTFLIYW